MEFVDARRSQVKELTFDDFVAAKAPLDHAPDSTHPFIWLDGAWRQRFLIGQHSEVVVDASPMEASWCEHVAADKAARS
jgi:hypothetical protein